MVIELYGLLEGFAMGPHPYRCLVITGHGDRAFCSGGDLKERNNMSDEEWFRLHLHYERLLRAILGCPIPLIGAINGAAYGGGCEIVAALDFAYAADNVRFAMPETTRGIIPGLGGTQLLSRAVGERRAKELIFSGAVFTANDACDWGLINAVYPQDQLIDETLKIATRIVANAPVAVQKAKQSIHQGLQMSLNNGIRFEIECYNQAVTTEDRLEGVRAFNEKRKPIFRGR
jgi:enoyl-CoA hydratase/carnithine racemase